MAAPRSPPNRGPVDAAPGASPGQPTSHQPKEPLAGMKRPVRRRSRQDDILTTVSGQAAPRVKRGRICQAACLGIPPPGLLPYEFAPTRMHTIQSSPVQVDRPEDRFRVPTRHALARSEDFEEKFDFRTLFYDVFWSADGTEILGVGPPFRFGDEPGQLLEFIALPSGAPCEFRHARRGGRCAYRPFAVSHPATAPYLRAGNRLRRTAPCGRDPAQPVLDLCRSGCPVGFVAGQSLAVGCGLDQLSRAKFCPSRRPVH